MAKHAASRSLAVRLALGAAALLAVGLLGGAILLSSIFRESVERSFDTRLTSALEGLISISQVGADASLELETELTDPRFRQPLSGWYWQIAPANKRDIRSQSLWDETLKAQIPTAEQRILFYEIIGPSQQKLRVITRRIVFPESEQPFFYTVAGDRSDIDEEVDAFNAIIAWSLGILFFVLIVAVFLQVRFGLAPLRRIQPALAAIRNGQADRLSGPFPAEVAPLATELNALLDDNAQVVERARTHVGNLAHALKTPLAVLTNEAAGQQGAFAETVARQTEIMRAQVEHHLQRARLAARAGVAGARTTVMPVLEDLRRTLERIHRDRALAITVGGDHAAAFKGERQDLEDLLGNLLDNACKWAKSKVAATARLEDGRLRLRIEDDGKGLTPAERRQALKRGVRLDEQSPGSGLGLSIVHDICEIYGGSMAFEDSTLGGLAVLVDLPGAETE
ncbi:MAG: sensor histidine kinase [Alphaproteobacteria bacterium]